MNYIERAKTLSDAIFHSVYGVERQRNSAIDILAQNASTRELEAELQRLNDFASNGLTVDFKTKVARTMQFTLHLESKIIEGKETKLPKNEAVELKYLRLNDGWSANIYVSESNPSNFETDGMLAYFNDFIRQLQNTKA